MIPKPTRKRAFELHGGNGSPWADAHTNEAEAWLRKELAEFARIGLRLDHDPPGRISFYLKGYDFADVEAYLQAAWIERAEAWPEEVAAEVENAAK